MWFKKLIHILRFKVVIQFRLPAPTDISKQLPNRKLCENLLNELQPDKFSQYDSTKGLSVFLTMPYPNIERYTNMMREASLYAKEKRAIPIYWADTVSTNLSLDRFLISNDGFYLDVSKAIHEFKKVGLQLCINMEKSDTESYGVYEHNLRMLTRLFVNMRTLTSELINVS